MKKQDVWVLAALICGASSYAIAQECGGGRIEWDFNQNPCLTCQDSVGIVVALSKIDAIACRGDPCDYEFCSDPELCFFYDSETATGCQYDISAGDPGIGIFSAYARIQSQGLAGFIELQTCGTDYCLPAHCPVLGWAVAAASYQLVFDNSCGLAVCVNPLVQASPETLLSDQRRRCTAIVHRVRCISSGSTSYIPVGLCSFYRGVQPVDMELVGSSWEARPQLCLCPGPSEIRSFTVRFDDVSFDLGGDGRFNQPDVDALAGQIGSTSPDLVPRFDLNQSGSIDEEDVELLQSLIDTGFSAGLLGDVNRDGLVNCDDAVALASVPDSVVGDPAYVIEADANLDGATDMSDRAAVCQAVRALVDLVPDGIIDFTDYLEFLNLFETLDPRVDFNHDGIVDFIDYLDFLNLFTCSC